ncbi:unnamed protein product [Cochlearia groenlandica]
MADGYWNQQRHHAQGGPAKRHRSDFEAPPPAMASGHDMHGGYVPRGEDLDVPDTRTIGSAYDRYLQSVQTPSMPPGEGGCGNGVAMGRPGGGNEQSTGEFMMRRGGGVHPLDHGPNGRAMGFDPPEFVDRRSREPLPLPPDATNTLFVEGLPSNCSRREVAHIFRPFVGYREVRLVTKDSKHRNGEPVVLCFVDFTNSACAATALSTLQGYRMDENEPDSKFLRLQFSRRPTLRPGQRGRSLKNMLGLLDNGGGGGGGGGVGGSGKEEKDLKMEEKREVGGGDGGGGNRWPRPETLALLRIRSEMDKAFRDSTLKAPLWEEISRKMMDLGYKRSAKKCKEKFENVYKYHKRTKEGRTGKSEGKTYRFFKELEAFDTLNPYPHEPATTTTATMTTSLTPWSNNPSQEKSSLTLKHQDKHQVSTKTMFTTNPTLLYKQPSPTYTNDLMNNVSSMNLFSSSTSSSTASEEEEEDHHQVKRSSKKRKYWKGLFTKLMEKQEKMQKRFLETLENRERERISREEAWRNQEVARITKEHERLVNERSNVAAKDSAIISFLHKISGGQQQQPQPQQQQNHKVVSQRKQYETNDPITFESTKEPRQVLLDTTMKIGSYNVNNSVSPSSSRWPKTEVEALISIRRNLEANYQENGTKGPLWEEISSGMRRLGYNRSAKRCKEKWENINKYFKKVKESDKKRPLDSKTCPYFNQLEALYNERRAMPILPLMAQRELLVSQETHTEFENDHRDKVVDKEEGESGQEDDCEVEEGEGDNETSEFDIVLNKTSSPMDINNKLFT